MNPAIRNVNLDFTTHCDRRCPECCCGIGIHRVLQHHPWEYFQRAADLLYGIPRVNLTGGEPTLHPQFAEFVPNIKTLFGCERLTMITDGFQVAKHWQIIQQHIDGIEFTDYHTRPATVGLLANQSIVPVSVFDAGANMEHFTARSRRGNGNPCERAVWRGGTIAYADGNVYGCCVAPGIDGAMSVETSPGWDERIMSAPLPCGECFFAE